MLDDITAPGGMERSELVGWLEVMNLYPALMFISNMYLTPSLSLSHSLSLPALCTCAGFCKTSVCVCATIGNEGRSCILRACVYVWERERESERASLRFVSVCNSFVGLQQSQSLCWWNWGSLILMRNPCSIYPALLLLQNLACVRDWSQCSTIHQCLVCTV